MGTLMANWQDEDNNRNIQFSVTYARIDSNIEIREIVPTSVSIVCPETNTCLKTIGVHTAKGKKLLAEKIQSSDRMDVLQQEIADRIATPTKA